MEKIFENCRTTVLDNGFSERTMADILPLQPPSRMMYRVPTLIATAVAAVAIVIITLTVGLDTMNERYEQLTAKTVCLNIDDLNQEEF